MPISSIWYRVFPWDPGMGAGDRFSPGYVPDVRGNGRFDVPTGVIYLAEMPEHAVAEQIQALRGDTLDGDDLVRFDRSLAIVEVFVTDNLPNRIADLCEPHILTKHTISPDDTAVSREFRWITRDIAGKLYDSGYLGMRWWSSFWGEWHTVVLFSDRLQPETLRYGEPVRLHLDHDAVKEACRRLGIERAAS